MRRFIWLVSGCVLLLAIVVGGRPAHAALNTASAPSDNVAPMGLFDAMNNGQADAKFIALSDRAARVIITNKTNQPLNLQLPQAFAGVPALAQFGGGGRAGGGGAGRSTSRGGGRSGGGGQQSVGGGLGGGGGGGLGGGGGGGIFSVPPEQTRKLDVPVLCLDHGLRNPSSGTPYRIVPPEDILDRPAVIELLQAFGNGELDHGAAQAAAWHLNNDLSWNELSAKREGTRRTPSRKPYFTADQIRQGMAYATHAEQLAEQNRDQYQLEAKKKEREESSAATNSESRSTSEELLNTSPTAERDKTAN